MKNVLLFIFSFIYFYNYSAVGITVPNLNINTCAFPSAYSNLGNIVVDEGALNDFPITASNTDYTFALTAPANFQFNAGVGAVASNGADITTISVVVTATTITVTYRSNQANRTNGDDVITISGVQVRAITGAATQSATKTASTETIVGFANGTVVANFVSAVSCGCTHTLRLTDTFGDGWNGGTVSVSVNGVNVLTNVTLAAGFGPSDLTFNAATGDLIRVYETAGGTFPTEMRTQILDGGLTSIIASHEPVAGTVNSGGSTGNGNCPPPMTFTSSTVTQSSVTNISNCSSNELIIRLEITTAGLSSPLTLTQIQSNFSGTALPANVSLSKVYYTGTSTTFSTSTLFGSAVPTVAIYNINGSQNLQSGTNYFWLVYDLNNTGTVGTTVDAIIPQFTLSAVNRIPTVTNPAGTRTIIICTAPGGVANSTLWLKSNASTNTTTNNTLVSSWASQVLPSITVTQGTAANQPLYKDGSGNTTDNRFNYNPFIFSDGVNDYLQAIGSFNIGNGNAGNGFSMFQIVGFNSGIVSIEWKGPNGMAKLKGDGIYTINNQFGGMGTNNQFTQASPSFQAHLASIRGHVSGLTAGKYNGVLKVNSSNNQPNTAAEQISIFRNNEGSEYLAGGVGEFIVFPSVLTATQNLQVESYLAIKYGITLGTSANLTDYLSSDGTQIWTGNANYQNNIIGIGRDDASVLLQKQSHNYDDTVRIYKGTLSSTNVGNAATFSVDKSFVVVGANTGKMCATASSNAEVPSPALASCVLTSRLEREWRIKKTNFGENFNMDFKLSNSAAPASVTTAHLRFLVDDDGNFANGGTTCFYNGDGSGIVISYSNPVITVSNISNTHIANNVTRFVTIASIDIATPLPIELLTFEANLNILEMVDLTWETNSERDNDYFTIEKSNDGVNWEFFENVDGAGTTSTPQKYYLEDKTPYYGTNYYKLKQTDFNGLVTLGGIKTVELLAKDLYFLSPNPANKAVLVYGDDINEMEISLYNNLGEKVLVNINNKSKINAEVDTKELSSGIYYVFLSKKNFNKVLKLIIEN
ncbi:MAG: T9SS type A sorting domain-containing protein [Flavobacteriia bacterium]|nr:T9SS type A sorting domain-containing protein [Flavobacteriia bacterium]